MSHSSSVGEIPGVVGKIASIPPMARNQAAFVVRWPRYRFGWKRVTPATEMQFWPPPATEWAAAAAAEAASIMKQVFVRHSERAWYFGSRLAEASDDDVDPELLYVACMLHDVGLYAPIAGRCFTAKGAEVARETARDNNVPAERAERVVRAITQHVSPRTAKGSVARYLQAGTLLDVTGYGVWNLPRSVVLEATRKPSRKGFSEEARDRWIEECARFPCGWSTWVRRPGGVLLAMKLSPLPGELPSRCNPAPR